MDFAQFYQEGGVWMHHIAIVAVLGAGVMIERFIFLFFRFNINGAQFFNQVQKLVAFDGWRWVERLYNVGDAELEGGLFDVKWRTDALHLPELTLRGNVSYMRTRLSNKVDGLGAGEGPRKSANLGFDYDFSAWPLTLGGNYNYIGPLDRESSARVRQAQGERREVDLYALYRLDRQLSLNEAVLRTKLLRPDAR